MALRNKLFHQWNRFYLLISVFISLVAPIVQVSIMHQVSDEPNKAIQMLQVFQSADGYLEEVTVRGHKGVSSDQWLMIIYVAISILLLFTVLLSLRKIFSIIRSHTVQWIEKIKFISSKAQGTPFSFFNFIFWNEDIDIQTETGKQIFQHELVHVKEKHTLDKLFVQLILVVFWCNPFFWLIRRELQLIHEFIADKKSVGERGAAALAAMILSSSYPSQFNSLTNQFFQTSIKRRLAMLTKIQNVKINYISRILALPILAITVLAFTLRTKTVSSVKLDKQITVVIDAGHGIMPDGGHTGAKETNVYEDNITLAIAKKISELNANDKIKIVLTRNSDAIIDLHKRVDIAKENHADLFISLHVNATDPNQSPDLSSSQSLNKGIEIYVSGKQPSYQQQSELFGSVLQQELNSVYSTNPYLLKRKVGVWVLDQNVCPSVLVECGFLTDEKDREFITNENNQTVIAEKVLKAIERYTLNKQEVKNNISDTIPKKQVQIKNAVVKNPSSSEKKDTKISDIKTNWMNNPPLFIVDGKEMSKAEVDKIDPNTIESIDVLKEPSSVSEYGKKGANGVVQIHLKTKESPFEQKERDTVPHNEIFTKTEHPAYIDQKDWIEFLQKNMQSVVERLNKTVPAGKYTLNVKFIVKKDGSLDDFVVLNDPGFGMGKEVIEIMKKSPKWKPAIQNGKPANSYHTQPITLVISDGDEKKDKNSTSKVPEIKLSDLKTMNGLNIPNIKSFIIVVILNNGNLYSYPNKGARFDEQVKALWSNLEIGSIITFENILAVENGIEVKKPALIYRVIS